MSKTIITARALKLAEEGEPDTLSPRVSDFAREHRDSLYTSAEDVPTRLRDLKSLRGPIEANVYFVPDLLSGSDYSGGSVEVGNYRSFMKHHENTPGVYPVVGSHNSFAVAIRLNVIDDAMIQAFESLEEYPAIDDDTFGQVQYEAKEEAWTDWVKGDFEGALIMRFPDFAEAVYAFPDEHLKAMFETLRKRGQIEWTEDSGNRPFIDVQKVANAAIPEDFQHDANHAREDEQTLEDLKVGDRGEKTST